MISRTATYALNILGFLVRRPGERTPGEEIARQTGVPSNYLSKILNQLRKHGIVDASKGWGGGFQLRAEALERPIRDVLAIIDGAASTKPEHCIFGLPKCDASHPCPLHNYWERVREVHAEMLNATTIQDLGEIGP